MTNGIDRTLEQIVDEAGIPERVTNKLILATILELRDDIKSMEARIKALEQTESKWKNRAVGMAAVVTVLWTIITFAVGVFVV